MRHALAHSINTATIRLAEMVGYDKVVTLAHAAGIEGVRATPAMAIGAYDATPLAMAEAMRDAIPGATLEVLDGAAHLTPLERPKDVARCLLELSEAAR